MLVGTAREARCEKCGCDGGAHEDLQPWLRKVQTSISRFRDAPTTTKRLPPSSSSLPVCVLQWSADEVALSVLTAGRFHPRRKPVVQPGLISVCVPTSAKRHAFHPLLYENFRRQNHSPKELVVVDTGIMPSAFLQAVAQQDDRVFYYHFSVEDAKHDIRRAAWQGLHPRSSVARPRAASELYEPPPDSWSLGLKRNVAVALAAGDVIAHFDDDDLYAAEYLTFMADKLCRAVTAAEETSVTLANVNLQSVIITLQEWHMLDFADLSFRHIDPQTDPAVPDSWRRDMIYGYGFSYMYTRRAWETQAFPDTEDCEDDIFIARLRDRHKAVVALVKLQSREAGLVAHSFHSDNTGVSEFNGSRRLGTAVSVPESLAGLLPVLREVAAKVPRPAPPRPWSNYLPLWPLAPNVWLSKRKGSGKGSRAKTCHSAVMDAPWLRRSFLHHAEGNERVGRT